LLDLAQTGVPYFKWTLLQELFAVKLVKVIEAFRLEFSYAPILQAYSFEHRRILMVEALRSFSDAPFTVQRLAEVLIDPKRQYRATHKLINGLEKLLAVSTTIPQEPPPAYQEAGEESNESNGNPLPPGVDPMDIEILVGTEQNHLHTSFPHGVSSMEG